MPDNTSLDQLKHGTVDCSVEDLILRRWSPRAFAEKMPSATDIKSIFTAGSWAASSYNEQPWRFVIGFKGEETWNKIFGALLPANQAWAKGAPVLFASFAKKTFAHNGKPNSVAVHDVGAASAVLSLQATALGMHTHGMAGFDKAALQVALNVPEDFEPVACWALGYLGDPESLPEGYKNPELQPRQRKALKETLFTKWDEAAL
jgi:nitroreductase